MVDAVSSLLRARMSYTIRAHLFSRPRLNPLGNSAGAHTCWSLLRFKTRRKPLSYPNAFLFGFTWKEGALVSVFERQSRVWALNFSLDLKQALNTAFTTCSCC